MAAANKFFRVGIYLIALFWIVAIAFLIYSRAAGDVAGGLLSVDIALTVCLVSSLTAVALTSVLILLYYRESIRDRRFLVDDMRRLLSGQTHTEAVLTQINENLLLSDAIKSVAFREKDCMVLQEAIQQDMRQEKWTSAERLIDEMEKRFRNTDETKQLRQELQKFRHATMQEKIDGAIKHIESLWMIHHYDDAEKECEALLALYPGDERVRGLRGQTEKRRQGHKKELLARWDKAVNDNDVDQGVEILKLLDAYLTPTEAAALEESARGVFRAKLHNMGVQFSLFVTEKQWDKALQIGSKIIEQFPNTRMAQEVREKLDILRQRAETPS